MTMLRAQERVVRDCRPDHSLFPFARSGLWGKLPDWTEFVVPCSSRAEQSDSRDAHFLSGAKKCCVSLTAALPGFASGGLAEAFRADTI